MDSQNVGRGRGSVKAALAAVHARTLVVSVSSDILFPPVEQEYLARHIPRAQYASIDSDYGHNEFVNQNKGIEQGFR